ncbi:hypothetical protein MJG53_000569 [Ovis ammon polii x Ovis aries]|uniref:Uncharacterized protein n=1 Tax=Ovis ammon polii x Ovis aries TaxID=2918886 RepID=A0ACB9VI47_9CETA|nr:hypothetical protein MJG53_000569 [Ovis ammon polii x Ovis aries]
MAQTERFTNAIFTNRCLHFVPHYISVCESFQGIIEGRMYFGSYKVIQYLISHLGPLLQFCRMLSKEFLSHSNGLKGGTFYQKHGETSPGSSLQEEQFTRLPESSWTLVRQHSLRCVSLTLLVPSTTQMPEGCPFPTLGHKLSWLGSTEFLQSSTMGSHHEKPDHRDRSETKGLQEADVTCGTLTPSCPLGH